MKTLRLLSLLTLFAAVSASGTLSTPTSADPVSPLVVESPLSLPALDWSQLFGGGAYRYDRAATVATDADDNIIVLGTTREYTVDGTEFASRVLKYNPAGHLLWTRRNLENRGNGSSPRGLAIDHAGNIYITGDYAPSSTGEDFVTLKYAPDGTELWRVRYNGLANGDDVPAGINVDSAGNVFVSGSSAGVGTFDDVYAAKYDTNGHLLWDRRYNGSANGFDEAHTQTLDSDGNLYITGVSQSAISSDLILIKYDTDGTRKFVRRYHGSSGSYVSGSLIELDSTGSIIVSGRIPTGYITVKYDSNGNKLWRQYYTDSTFYLPEPTDLKVDSSDNIIVTGTGTNGGATIKYAPDGSKLWEKHDQLAQLGYVTPTLATDSVGNVYVGSSVPTGSSTSYADFVVVKYAPDGTQAWRSEYDYGYEDDSAGLALDSAGNVVQVGTAGSDILTVKLTQ